VSRRRADRTLIAAGLVTIALGALFLLDRLSVIDVRFGYAMPAVLAAMGVVLLVEASGSSSSYVEEPAGGPRT
jgi:uncharacterized membrane protein YidH (DUF202 family)